MGMYSTYIQQDIEVKDKDGLMKASKEIEDDMGLICEDEVDFSAWDGHKIEGYWYEETRKILKTIAPFIEGYAEFLYEEGYSFRILFENGKVYFQRATVTWEGKEELE
ncbi:hypothetical protein KY326_03585 [Candidatus Woesearchaeota archaeon]|nr:hypothetical protein [Candidatus Woesearchaeota archaeon]